MFLRRLAAASAFLIAMLPSTVSAHPLGNFTVNHLTRTTFTRDGVSLRYVLDMAEIPAYQTLRELSPSGRPSRAELDRWADREAAVVLHDVHVSEAGTPIALRLVEAHARLRPGAGGLATLYLTVDAARRRPHRSATDAFRVDDETFAGRLGWRDALAGDQLEPTHDLTAYPAASLGSPRSSTVVVGTVEPDGRMHVDVRQASAPSEDVVAAPATVAAPASMARSNQLSDMLARGTGDWSFVALTFLVAIALGALHALEPGHGKTLLAISLVGARATVRQAAILAAALTVAHTIGVLALGVALNLFKGYFVPETIYPWITLISGVVVAVIGARAIARVLQARGAALEAHAHAHGDVVHSHGPGGHHHHGAEMDDAEHALLHAIPGTAPMRFGPTVWAAMSGGIAPCPAALVVLLAAVALNQTAYGIFVIVAFSFGLAATLTTLGIAVVRGASWLQRRPAFDRFVRFGPAVSATVIALIGAIMVGQGFAERGGSAPPYVVSLIVVCAIAGYAFSHPFTHRHAEFE